LRALPVLKELHDERWAARGAKLGESQRPFSRDWDRLLQDSGLLSAEQRLEADRDARLLADSGLVELRTAKYRPRLISRILIPLAAEPRLAALFGDPTGQEEKGPDLSGIDWAGEHLSMSRQLLRTPKLTNFLSFGPDSQEIHLTPLNVLIGPNASGKSNFIEAVELLHATPTDFSDPIRIGGTAGEWLWKGLIPAKPAELNARLWSAPGARELRCRLAFTDANNRVEVVDEVLEETTPRRPDEDDVFF
jgi:hypothetical protein